MRGSWEAAERPRLAPRCNTCYIVNLRYCKAVDGFLVNVNGEELQISRSRKKEFMSALTGSFR